MGPNRNVLAGTASALVQCNKEPGWQVVTPTHKCSGREVNDGAAAETAPNVRANLRSVSPRAWDGDTSACWLKHTPGPEAVLLRETASPPSLSFKPVRTGSCSTNECASACCVPKDLASRLGVCLIRSTAVYFFQKKAKNLYDKKRRRRKKKEQRKKKKKTPPAKDSPTCMRSSRSSTRLVRLDAANGCAHRLASSVSTLARAAQTQKH